MKKKTSKTRYVLCIENNDYEASLEPRKIYEVLPDKVASKHDMVRVIDESGEDYLFPTRFFAPKFFEFNLR